MLRLSQSELYIVLASVLVLVLIVTIILFITKKPKKVVPSMDFDELLVGLGGKENLSTISMEHQRLKVTVKDLKKVDQTVLKKLEIPAFLKGKELTLLIKHQTKEVLSYLSERQKEVN